MNSAVAFQLGLLIARHPHAPIVDLMQAARTLAGEEPVAPLELREIPPEPPPSPIDLLPPGS